MKSVRSMVVAFDGESKCGKTTIIESVKREADFQASVIPDILDPDSAFAPLLSAQSRISLAVHQENLTFNNVFTLSAGNLFRAAALLVLSEERAGRPKMAFDKSDVPKLKELLDTDGAYDILQNDPEVGSRVTPVATMVGIQALCGAVFSDSVVDRYCADGEANLVIVDARNPVGILQRNNVIGTRSRQIHPASILPIYIDTPVEVAAARLKGDLGDNIASIRERRHTDATRIEFPVTRPTNLISDFGEWLHQFSDRVPASEVAAPYHLDNGEGIGLDNIQYFAGRVSVTAQDVACHLNRGLALAQ